MEASLRKAKLKSTRMGGQIEHLRNELDVARDQERSAAEAADKEREASRRKIVELESAATTANREHTLFKERTEERLERLRIAVEDEERENGSQVCEAANVGHCRCRVSQFACAMPHSLAPIVGNDYRNCLAVEPTR